MWAKILEILGPLLSLAQGLFDYFKKKPDEIIRAKLNDDLQGRKESADEISQALKKSDNGDTSDINKLLNRR